MLPNAGGAHRSASTDATMSSADVSQSSSSASVPASVPHFKRRTQDDNFSTYRHLCEVRLRRLERYKKAKSFCSLDDEQNASQVRQQAAEAAATEASDSSARSSLHSASHSTLSSDSGASMASSMVSGANSEMPSPTSTLSSEGRLPAVTAASELRKDFYLRKDSSSSVRGFEGQFEMLREKMISLMENDVQLLQKLLTLGDTIQEIRSKQDPAQRCSSETSLSSAFEEEEADEWRPMGDQFSSSMSAITRLYVADEDDEDELRPNVQYFSRKNSVLRIPIPPRASNRAFTRRNATRPVDVWRFAAKANANGVPRLHTLEDSAPSSPSSAPLSPASPPLAASSTFNMSPSYRPGPLSTAAAASSAKIRFSKSNGYEPFSLSNGSMQGINMLTSKSRQERWASRFAN